MPTLPLIEYEDASEEVRRVYDDIMATRRTDKVNNFWKAVAHDPATLKRTWESLREVMRPGALDPLVKEMLYVAISASNGCDYCIASHTASARARGMTKAMFGELMAVVGMANETNRLVSGYRVPIDEAFLAPWQDPAPALPAPAKAKPAPAAKAGKEKAGKDRAKAKTKDGKRDKTAGKKGKRG